MTGRSVVSGILLGALALLTPIAGGSAFGATLEVEAFPTLGQKLGPFEPGWTEYVVRVRNHGTTAKRGIVELSDGAPGSTGQHVSQTAFSVEPRSHTTVRSVFLRELREDPTLVARIRDESGAVVGESPIESGGLRGTILLDLDPSARLRTILRDSELPLDTVPLPFYGQPRNVVVTTPRRSPVTGLPIVPALPAGYADATLVFAPISLLGNLSPAELRTLGDWVLSGGALAVAVDSPAALDESPFREWLGGETVETDPPRMLLGARPFPTAPPSDSDTSSGSSRTFTLLAPTPAVREALRGYRGPGLRDTEWGAAATYGLGEIHLLAFKPTLPPFAADPWVRRELEGLLTNVVANRLKLALPHGRPLALSNDNVRRLLDPNQTVRWALLVAAGLLLIHAVVAGPLNFSRAAARGRPLVAVPRMIACAAVASAVIVALGLLSRGVKSRARHLTLVEVGAGMSRGAAVRLRGFYTSRARELRIAASSSRAVLAADSDLEPRPRIEVDPRGLVLSGVRTTAWQTTVVRDDGFIDLGGGIALVRAGNGKVVVVNRSGRDLVGVMLKQPGDESLYFHARIRDGERVVASEGHRLPASMIRSPSSHSPRIAELGEHRFGEYLERTDSGATLAWGALSALSGVVDWWPTDVPVLIGQLSGGEGHLVDSGLSLDFDRVHVRVIGYGGSE